MRFEWDPAKERANRRKHGLSFDEAKALFRRPEGWLEEIDLAHADDEDRFIAIGPIRRGLVAVVFVERDEDFIRIVSARFATVREARRYDAWVQGTRE